MSNIFAEKVAIGESVWWEQGNLYFFCFFDTLFKPVWVALRSIPHGMSATLLPSQGDKGLELENPSDRSRFFT